MTIRILSLDDEPQMADLYRLILERKGYEFTGSSDSYEAWALLHAQPFDLFTQDLMRPDVDGWEFYQAMKADEVLRDMPVIILTANVSSKAALMEAGADAYVTLPFGPQELLDTVADVLRKRGKSPPVKGERDHLRDERAAGDIIGSRQDVPGLIQMLRNDAWPRRCTAAIAFGRDKDVQAVEPLIQALRDEVSYVRMMAALALGKIGDARAIEPLLPVLTDEDGWVRQTAAKALGQMADPRAIGALVRALHDPAEKVGWLAARSLGQIGALAAGPLVKELHSIQNANVRQAAVWALGRIKKRGRAVDTLILTLQDESSGVRAASAQSLGYVKDKRAVESLIAVLQDEDAAVRDAAACALGELRDKRAVEPLIASLQDDVQNVRQQAAFALTHLGRPAVELLVENMRSNSAQVREAITGALWLVKDQRKRVLHLLIAALQDKDVRVRRAAIRSLEFMRDKRAVDPLIALLQGEDMGVVEDTIGALQWIRDARAIPYLERMAREDHRQARYGAIADIARGAIKWIETRP